MTFWSFFNLNQPFPNYKIFIKSFDTIKKWLARIQIFVRVAVIHRVAVDMGVNYHQQPKKKSSMWNILVLSTHFLSLFVCWFTISIVFSSNWIFLSFFFFVLKVFSLFWIHSYVRFLFFFDKTFSQQNHWRQCNNHIDDKCCWLGLFTK